MKKLLLLTLLLFGIIKGVSAQGRIDTLYYTNDWKQAPDKAFASFYRVAYYPADSLAIKQYRDYYVSGELQSMGKFVRIDATDDANTIFDGECVNYFKNGKPSEIRNYKNGDLNGLYSVYFEDGSVKASGTFFNGSLCGLYTEFSNNGEFAQMEYVDGKPKYDYYIKGDSRGNLMKFRIADNAPVWESPSVSERKVEYQDGTPWQVYNKNGLIIALTNSTINDYGKWHRLDIIISNNTITPIVINPVENITARSINSKMEISELKVWSSDEYLRKVNRAQVFAAVMMGIAEGMATASAGYSTYTTKTYHSGRSYAYGSRGYTRGYYSGYSTSTTRVYDAHAAYHASVHSQQRISDFVNAMAREQEVKKFGYLKMNTVNPGDVISGYVHVKRVKGEKVQFIVNIEGAEYVFDWDFGKRKNK